MASISLPPQPQASSTFSHYLDSTSQSPRGHNRRNLSMSHPLPNPPFVFPARDPDATPDAPEPMANPGAPAPLPAFSFNPGVSHSSQPSMPTLPVNRPGGHRRRCSEFIGTEHLVSPETAESTQNNNEPPTPAPPSLPTPGPGFSAGGPGRRRHAHRRSAAISSVDLTGISNALDVKPSNPSAPGSPANATLEMKQPLNEPNRPTPPASPSITINGESLYPAQPISPVSPIAPDHDLSEAPPKDSESTVVVRPESTARNSDQAGPFHDKGPKAAKESPKPRPRTADASLMLSYGGADDMSRFKRPLSATGHSRFRKSLSSGVLDAALRKDNDGNHPSWADFHHSSDGDSDTSGDDHYDTAQTGPKKKSKVKKRQKKVRSWAGSILTRGKGKRQISKNHSSEEDSGISPPAITRTNSDLGSGLDVDFDDDNIVVIRTPTNTTVPKMYQTVDDETQATLETSWKPRSFYEQGTTVQSDALSPIIDLDAALGPFNTPDLGSRNMSESGFSAASRRMYSGGRRGEFIGPEMRYHRRAESAPALPPFDRSFLTNNRLSTNLSLENPDVFYEEEEDAFLAATSESARESDGPSSAPAIASSVDDDTDGQSVRSKESSDTLTHHSVDETGEGHAGLGIGKEGEPPDSPIPNEVDSGRYTTPPPEQRSSAEQLRDSVNPFSSPIRRHVQAMKPEDWQRKIPIPPSPDISPRFLPADHRPATSPLEMTPNIPQFSLQGGSSLSNSSFPSPNFTISSDVPRSITTSSTTDRNFSNISYNPSMDFPHTSVEDVPSLTSSTSTMTNTLNRFSANFFQHTRISTDRSASFSAAVHRRSSQPNSSKRSSLASLSKLVGGPHAERSKLSHEEKPPGDEPEKGKRKGRRISRLMHFWRMKDKDRLNEDAQEERPS
ncbi:hypothetical protein FE257_011574 [Aspergillus nanangensis]|uniref:Cell wall proline rich protein n=1 Tax=Aspergillus nanangensis TaxID=2582783 RepID=A0AAD4GRA2_ASPNN|nr:hypothetical protein FE257_011574 [Aspergillus nanangensis]